MIIDVNVKGGGIMQQCPYCSGELEDDDDEVRPCPECGSCLHWDGEVWQCSNCDYSEED